MRTAPLHARRRQSSRSEPKHGSASGFAHCNGEGCSNHPWPGKRQVTAVVVSSDSMPRVSHSSLGRRGAIAMLVGAVAIVGCQLDKPGPTTLPADAEELPILWQTSGTYSRLTKAVRLVIRDAGTLAQVPLCEVPVNFETEMVLLAGLGPTPRSDCGIVIQQAWKKNGRIWVLERQVYPGSQMSSGLRPASPWTVVVVPRSDLDVEGYSSSPPRGLLLPGSPPH